VVRGFVDEVAKDLAGAVGGTFDGDFFDEVGVVGFEEFHDGQGFAAIDVESFGDGVGGIVGALDERGVALVAASFVLRRLSLDVVSGAAFWADAATGEAASDFVGGKQQDEDGAEGEIMFVEQIETGLDLVGEAWKTIEQEDGFVDGVDGVADDLDDEVGWGEPAGFEVRL
jgi:hypothetical protein